ncbi:MULTISPECIES: ABC transporter substrate-binding protein [Variovorax]|jgi:multiple sugar transport system substrate-binding protein|uniref:ABC transporter substrate-binding protein n=1 Tax=Variovorax TaxID=34072 RepID=UPI0024803FB7|nr:MULTISPECIES: substrate-binding domain-containing protein [Variovorax]MDR6889800.1 multiple sugar transport system substrate-binding protein [Variovorax sp. 3319]WGT65375.1 substrate-binding domain-containing protein [Variovorax paradoxus]
MTHPTPFGLHRRSLLKTSAALGAASLLPGLPGLAAAQGGAKKFAGVTLNVSTFSATYPKLLQQWLPEFEALTGAKVNFDAPSFPVYNQRVDLELSTRGSAYDVVNVTFIYSSRWINSGWLTPLDDYIRNPNLTSADWDLNDFLPGARAPETGKDGKLYGIPWTAEALLTASSRFDLLEKAGLAFPDTTDDLVKVLRAVHKKERVAGFVADNHYGWTFVPYLHAFGGDVFRKAPDDLFPTLDTPEAIAAGEYYANLLREFGPDGAITYQPDQVTQALKLGRVNFTDAGQLHLAQLGDPATSKTLKTVRFGQVPKGPAGRFPGTAVHGLGIPAGSKNKEAAWAFIQWALSKQTTRKAVAAGYGSPARRSDIDSAEFRQKQVINGSDLAKLSLDAIELASKTGHMKYRTVSVYPQIDQQLNKAIELIASGQLSAKQAFQQAQANSIAELKRAGQKL